jgi:hypothetical protein
MNKLGWKYICEIKTIKYYVSRFPQKVEQPALDKMTAEWGEAFAEALSRPSITRLRMLGEEAQVIDPQLSAWLLERVTCYYLEGLKRLGNYDINGATDE